MYNAKALVNLVKTLTIGYDYEPKEFPLQIGAGVMESVITVEDDNGCLFYNQLMHKKIFDRDKIPVD